MTLNSNVAILEEAQDIVLLFQFHLNFVLHTRMEYAGVLSDTSYKIRGELPWDQQIGILIMRTRRTIL